MRKRQFLTVLLLALSARMSAQTDIRVARYWGDCAAAVSYTFDDGLEEHYTKVFPELRKRGLRATFAVIGSRVGSVWKGTPCMTWEQLREMAADGQEITNHGWTHANLTRLDSEAMRYEVQHGDTVIYENTGVMPRTFVYPGNRHTPDVVGFCSRGRTGTRISQVSIGAKRDSVWLRRWVDGLMASGDWGVGMTHGITCGYDSLGEPGRLWHHFDYVMRHRDSLWVAPLADVAAYVAERDDVTISIRRDKDNVQIVPRMSLDKEVYNHPLTLVMTSDVPLVATQGGRRLYVRRRGSGIMIDFLPGDGMIEIRPMEGAAAGL